MTPSKLPSELEEEILYRVPPLSLARFRTVCKRWYTLFNTKFFSKNHLARVRTQFILRTNSTIYSIGINPDDSLEVRELDLESPGPENIGLYKNLYYCDGFLLCPDLWNEVAVWNPWLRQQTKLNDPKRKIFMKYGLGYDYTSPDTPYKILGFYYDYRYNVDVNAFEVDYPIISVYEFATNAWKDLKFGPLDWDIRSLKTVISLNGTSYWVAKRDESRDCFIQSFDFSKERFEHFCLLPCKNDEGDTQILAVFKGDRFSVLEQCHITRKIEIWVTRNKIIIGNNGEDVSWRKLMTVSIPDLPKLQDNIQSVSQPSYFIDNNDDRRLIVCTCEEIKKPCIYVVKGDSFKKILLDTVVDPWPSYQDLVYVTSLVAIPSAEIEQQE